MYTIQDLNTQLTHARNMVDAWCPGLRLTRTCADDSSLARKIEACDPFNQYHLDALDLADYCNPDTIEAQAIDPVAYYETSACEILDDEIDWLDRDGTPLASPIAVQCGYQPSVYED